MTKAQDKVLEMILLSAQSHSRNNNFDLTAIEVRSAVRYSIKNDLPIDASKVRCLINSCVINGIKEIKKESDRASQVRKYKIDFTPVRIKPRLPQNVEEPGEYYLGVRDY